jgi:hypothetical protein
MTLMATSCPIFSSALLGLRTFDDSEGYYRITPGEVLDNGRYQITVNLGKGMFAQVMRAKVLKPSNAEEKIGSIPQSHHSCQQGSRPLALA